MYLIIAKIADNKIQHGIIDLISDLFGYCLELYVENICQWIISK